MINLQDVSLKFRLRGYAATGLKELCMRIISPPEWQKKIVKTENEFWALQGINLDIQEGDRLGILGNNGAGKSTLLKVITHIYRPTKGMVTTQGRIASMIEIGSGFHPELTGRENVFLNAAITGIPKSEIEKRYEAIVDFAGIRDFMDMPVKYYSTGMYLRLAFTMATEIAPDTLILDELYAGGDIAFVKQATERLENFIKSCKVLVLVAHNTDYILKFCNRVIVLEQGRIIHAGPPEESVTVYRRMNGLDA